MQTTERRCNGHIMQVLHSTASSRAATHPPFPITMDPVLYRCKATVIRPRDLLNVELSI